MPRKSLTILGLAFVALLAVPALAQEQEVIYFTNGTTMSVESHSFKDGMIQVSLGGQSFLAFPVEKVEKIETESGEVALPTEPTNRMVPTPARPGIVRGEVPGNLRRGQWEGPLNRANNHDDNIGVDEHGVAVYRPFPADAPANKRQFGVAGRRELRDTNPSRTSGDGMIGTSRVGARYVLPTKSAAAGGQRRQPVGMQQGSHGSSKKDGKK